MHKKFIDIQIIYQHKKTKKPKTEVRSPDFKQNLVQKEINETVKKNEED